MRAENTASWLMTLHNRLAEVEADTEEARRKRRELSRLLVARITIGSTEDGSIQVHIIYRFGPPDEAETDGLRTLGDFSYRVSDSLFWYNAKRDRCSGRAKGAPSFMAYIHAIAAGDLEWALYTVSLLVSVLPDELLLIQRRGFGRRGFGFGRGRGSFRLVRILFALMFTTLLGPIVLVALIAFIAYSFFTSRRGR